jgi:putative membrane protein
VSSGHLWFLAVAGSLNLLVTLFYVRAVLRQWAAGSRWSIWRLGFWLAGSLALGWALSPGIMALAHVDLRWHMVQHLLLGMVAPLGLVLGAPVTLLLRSIGPRPGRWIVRILGSGYLWLITHPLTALLLNIGGMYVLYMTPLYLASQQSVALHVLVHVHFFAAGYLFSWSILAGPDRSSHRVAPAVRLAILALGIALHGALGKLMYAQLLPAGTGQPADQLRAAAQLMYYGGDLAEGLLLIALLSTWHRWRAPLGSARIQPLPRVRV